jgi:hypothetical protein
MTPLVIAAVPITALACVVLVAEIQMRERGHVLWHWGARFMFTRYPGGFTVRAVWASAIVRWRGYAPPECKGARFRIGRVEIVTRRTK